MKGDGVQGVCRIEAGGRGLSRVVDEAGRVVAWWWGGNLLREETPEVEGNDAEPVMMWSGWMGEDVFERDPRCWGPAGMTALRERLAALRAGGERRTILLRPHARHVLNDPQRCAAFQTEYGPLGFGLVLDAAAMLEDSMIAQAPDHLERIFERLGPLSPWVVVDDETMGLVRVHAPRARLVRLERFAPCSLCRRARTLP
ncbi:MAG: hypothetical protein ACKVZJ_04635 [Phycisphaerales bacterium]